MARMARVAVAGVAYHVTQRGNGRQFLLDSDAERLVYIDLLRAAARSEGLSVMGYCLMSNHVHLVGVPERAESLARALQSTHGRYASYWNAAHRVCGHAWQGRFYSWDKRTVPDTVSLPQINSVAGELSPIINDTKNVQLAIARNGQTLTDDIGNRQTLSGQNPGWTSFFSGNLRAYIVDPSTPLVSVPDLKMFPPVPGVTTPGILVGHELGHARAVMTGSMPGLPTFDSSRRIENKIRTRDDPNAPVRMTH